MFEFEVNHINEKIDKAFVFFRSRGNTKLVESMAKE